MSKTFTEEQVAAQVEKAVAKAVKASTKSTLDLIKAAVERNKTTEDKGQKKAVAEALKTLVAELKAA